MPRLPRVDVANEIYHVINRANGRMRIFSAPEDYRVFEKLMEEAKELTGSKGVRYLWEMGTVMLCRNHSFRDTI